MPALHLPKPEHGGAFEGWREPEPRIRPAADILDEEPLMCGEPFRVELRRVLMEAECLVVCPMDTDDQRRRQIRLFQESAPLRIS